VNNLKRLIKLNILGCLFFRNYVEMSVSSFKAAGGYGAAEDNSMGIK